MATDAEGDFKTQIKFSIEGKKKDFYAIFNVPQSFTKREIQKKYFELSKIYHPDRKGGDERIFKKISHAYETLIDEMKRKAYDAKRLDDDDESDDLSNSFIGGHLFVGKKRSEEVQETFDKLKKKYETNKQNTQQSLNIDHISKIINDSVDEYINKENLSHIFFSHNTNISQNRTDDNNYYMDCFVKYISRQNVNNSHLSFESLIKNLKVTIDENCVDVGYLQKLIQSKGDKSVHNIRQQLIENLVKEGFSLQEAQMAAKISQYENESDHKEWTCNICSLHNDDWSKVCATCNASKNEETLSNEHSTVYKQLVSMGYDPKVSLNKIKLYGADLNQCIVAMQLVDNDEKSENDTWICSSCTLKNNNEDQLCVVCGASNNEMTSVAGWVCNSCTFRNIIDSSQCEMCSNSKPLKFNMVEDMLNCIDASQFASSELHDIGDKLFDIDISAALVCYVKSNSITEKVVLKSTGMFCKSSNSVPIPMKSKCINKMSIEFVTALLVKMAEILAKTRTNNAMLCELIFLIFAINTKYQKQITRLCELIHIMHHTELNKNHLPFIVSTYMYLLDAMKHEYHQCHLFNSLGNLSPNISTKSRNDVICEYFPVIIGGLDLCQAICGSDYKINVDLNFFDKQKLIKSWIDAEFERAYYKFDYGSLVTLFYSLDNLSLVLKGAHQLLIKHNINDIDDEKRDNDELPPQFEAFWCLLKSLIERKRDNINSIENASRLLTKALLITPSKYLSDTIAIILQKDEKWQGCIYNTYVVQSLKQYKETQIPIIAKYQKWFRSDELQTVKLFERAIIKQYNQQKDNKLEILHQTALLYLDLTMAIPGGTRYFSATLLSCMWFIECMKSKTNVTASSIFAYQHIVTQTLYGLYLALLRGILSPQIRLNFLLLIFKCLRECCMVSAKYLDFETMKLCESESSLMLFDAAIWRNMVESILHLGRGAIISSIPFTLACDSIYTDLISRNLLSKFLEETQMYNITKSNNLMNKLCSRSYCDYFVFESIWKEWNCLDEEKDTVEKFYRSKYQLMLTLLEKKKWNITQVEDILNYSLIQRDKNGYIATPLLKFPNNMRLYSSIDGIEINLNTGNIELLLQSTNNPKEALFSMNDVHEILNMGIGEAVFSLDQPIDKHFASHPFQKMRYGPNRMAKSHLVATMFHCDYILKMITQGSEISSLAPFRQRNIFEEGFIKDLPQLLQKKLNLSEIRAANKNQDNESKLTGKCHRYWIEPKEIQYHEVNANGILKYRFEDNVDMRIKKHLMKISDNGEMIDDDDKEDDSSEAIFARQFSENYDIFSKYFPLFSRLKQLLKICGIQRVLSSLLKGFERSKKDLNVTEIKNRFDSSLAQDRSSIVSELPCWPLTNNENKLFQDTLAKNGVSESQVKPSEITRVRNEIRASLQSDQNQLVTGITNNLSSQFGLNASSINQYSYNWIADYYSPNGTHNSILTLIANSEYSKEINRYDTLINSIRRIGITSFDEDEKGFFNTDEKQDECLWIPAIFTDWRLLDNSKYYDNHKVYGGVRLAANLVKIGSTIAPVFPGIRILSNLIGAQNVQVPKIAQNEVSQKIDRVYVIRRPLDIGGAKKWWQKWGNVAHSALLLDTDDGPHILEYMNDGKSHLYKVDYKLPKGTGKQLNGAEVITINGVEWTKQKQGSSPQGNWTADRAKREMDSGMGGRYNVFNEDERCHSAQELVRKGMGIFNDKQISTNVMKEAGINRLKQDEGLRLRVYVDTEGYPTVGYGHKIREIDNLKVGDQISQTQADEWFRNDLKTATHDAKEVLGGKYWNELSAQRQDVLINMSYNLGRKKFSGFKKMLKAVREGDYNGAAAEMRDSKWHGQVTNRANRLIEKMQNN